MTGPSILDRVIGRLFPTAQYTGLLDPGAQRSVQQQGLLGLGAGLLQAGAPHPYQLGTLGNLGGALQQSQMSFPQMAEHALQIQAYKSQVAQQQAVADVAARHPATPGMSLTDQRQRMIDIAGELMTIPGGAALGERMSALIAAMKESGGAKREPMRVEGTNTKLGTPFVGREGTLLIDPDSLQQVGFLPKGQAVKEPTPAERVAASQHDSARESIAAMRAIAARNPDAVKQAVAAIKAARYGPLGQLLTEARGGLSSQDAQDFYTQYNNMLLTVTPTYGASRPTKELMDLEKAATLPAIGSGNFDTAFQHMDNRLKDLRAKAGKAFQGGGGVPRAAPAAPPAGYSADNPFATGTP